RALIESFTVITDPVTQRQLHDAEAKMDAAHAALDTNDFDTAAQCAEAGADLAMAAGDKDLERRTILQAVRAWGEHMGCQHLQEADIAATSKRARKLVERLQTLGERPGIIALELAQLGRFDRPASEVLEYVAQAGLDKDPIIRAEALVIHLHTLWRMKDLNAVTDLAATVTELGQMVPEDMRLVIDATWLRTLCKAGHLQDAIASPEHTSYQRTAMVIGQVASEFNMAGHVSESRALCEAAYRVVEGHADGRMLMNIALQAAELSAQLKDATTARLYLGRAESWATEGHEDAESAATARANVLFAKGRTLVRIADQTEPRDEGFYREAFDALQSALTFGRDHRLEIQGQVDLFLADVSWWLGRTAVNIGNLTKACECLKAVRSDAAMANRHFREEVVSRAWLLEAESLALAGRVSEAASTATALVSDA